MDGSNGQLFVRFPVRKTPYVTRLVCPVPFKARHVMASDCLVRSINQSRASLCDKKRNHKSHEIFVASRSQRIVGFFCAGGRVLPRCTATEARFRPFAFARRTS